MSKRNRIKKAKSRNANGVLHTQGRNIADGKAMRELNSRMNPISNMNVNPGVEPTLNPLTGQVFSQTSRNDVGQGVISNQQTQSNVENRSVGGNSVNSGNIQPNENYDKSSMNSVWNPQGNGNQNFNTSASGNQNASGKQQEQITQNTQPQGPTVYNINNSGGSGNQLGYNAALPNTQVNQQGVNYGLGISGDNQYNIFYEEGVSGLTRFGGFVYEEWLTELQGKRGALTYREMRDNDAIIGAIMYAIEMLIRQVNWSVEPAGETPADIEAAEFLESCMDDMSITWHDTISEIVTFVWFGWNLMELCYKVRGGKDQPDGMFRSKYQDGRIGWRKWAIRAQETLWRWRFDADGSILGMEQIAPPDYKLRFIPIQKALLFRTKSNKNNPEGRSLLRNVYRTWYFKKNIEEIESIGIERDLAGYPLLRLPEEIFEQGSPDAIASYQSWRKLITRIKRDEQEGLMLPSTCDDKGNRLFDIEMLTAGGARRQFDTNQIIQRLEGRMAMTLMADFLTLGHEATGSYALGESKTTLFQLALGTILQNIKDVINTYGVERLFQLNNFPGITDYPKIIHDEIEKANLDQLSNYILRMSQAGAIQTMGDTELENNLREAANLPERPDWLDTPTIPLTGGQPIPGAGQQFNTGQQPSQAGGKQPSAANNKPSTGQTTNGKQQNGEKGTKDSGGKQPTEKPKVDSSKPTGVQKQNEEINEYIEEIRKLRKEMIENARY